MRPYSKDLRLRVLAAVDAGKPREEISETFSVSEPTITRWLRRRCQIARALRAVTPQDALGWFAESGYWVQNQYL